MTAILSLFGFGIGGAAAVAAPLLVPWKLLLGAAWFLVVNMVTFRWQRGRHHSKKEEPETHARRDDLSETPSGS
jgi:hypothetical protein